LCYRAFKFISSIQPNPIPINCHLSIPTTLLNSSILLFDGAFSFSICKIMSSAYRGKLSSFPVWMSSLSFSYLNDLANTSNTILSKSCESGHPCLALALRGNHVNFSSLQYNIGLYYGEIYTFLRLLPWRNVGFYQMLTLQLLRWSHGFCPSFFWCKILCFLISICQTIFASWE
jgi:hypothetical protein